MSIFATKSIEQLKAEAAATGEHSLKRVLGPINLVTLGIGAIIGTGIFVLTGEAAAQHSGPAIVLSMVLAVALQRVCAAGPKRDLPQFLEESLPLVSCLRASAFTGQAFHRIGQAVTERELEVAQVALAKAAVGRFKLSTDVLAFDTTNFDTHIATTTAGELARRGHAKSKRNDLCVVGLGLLVSETGHVPLMYRAYSGNASDQGVLESCLEGLRELHNAVERATILSPGTMLVSQPEIPTPILVHFPFPSWATRASEAVLATGGAGDDPFERVGG